MWYHSYFRTCKKCKTKWSEWWKVRFLIILVQNGSKMMWYFVAVILIIFYSNLNSFILLINLKSFTLVSPLRNLAFIFKAYFPLFFKAYFLFSLIKGFDNYDIDKRVFIYQDKIKSYSWIRGFIILSKSM